MLNRSPNKTLEAPQSVLVASNRLRRRSIVVITAEHTEI